MGEARICWLLYGIVALGVLITYSRIPPEELYHVSRGGLWGGLSRVLVFMNFPTALMAIAVLALVAARTGKTALWWLSLACCLVIVVPGVVDEGDLDAKWINIVPAIGVLLALVLTLRAGLGAPGDPRGDRLRVVVGTVLAVLSIPWIFAELGFHVGSPVFLTSKIWEGEAAVHLGEHHGFESLLLIVTALLLSRQLSRMRRPTPLAAYLSLMIAYGLANMANDGWKEQVVKRGWTSWEIPGVLNPGLTWMWGLILVAGAAIYLACLRRGRPA